MRAALCAAVTVAALSLFGCGKSADGPAVVPTTSRAAFDNKPAAGAMLLFHAQGTPTALPSPPTTGCPKANMW